MKKLVTALMIAAAAVLLPQTAMATGMLKMESPHSVKDTLDRLQAIFEEKNITVFARIDHAAGARSIGSDLLPTELMIFGNPKLGTPLMKLNQEVAFDLPLKALAWKDKNGKVWLAVTNPAELNQTYALAGANGVIEKMTGALKGLTQKALEK